MARMLYLNERLWFSSTLTLATLIASAFSRAISSSKGAIILHGPHHSAQKSTSTGLSLCSTSLANVASVTVLVLAPTGAPRLRVRCSVEQERRSIYAIDPPDGGPGRCVLSSSSEASQRSASSAAAQPLP